MLDRELVSSQSTQSHPATDLRIVLIGGRSDGRPTGKSSAGNIILGQNVFNTSRRTAQSEARQQEVFSRRVTVVDTPGWWWRWPRENTPKLDQIEIQNSVHLCPPGPHVFLLLVPIIRSFTEKDLKALLEIMKPLTERVWRHCMVLFTRGDWINDDPVENYIVREGKELQELLEKCGNRYHVINPYHSQDPVPIKDMFQKCFDIVKQNRGCFTIKAKQLEEEWKRREQELIERMM
uniref:AIG1-type G domain-containing protein n=1 Tax=Poecilia formosa TaxID=48698 RepID=A0A096MHL1_POEFO